MMDPDIASNLATDVLGTSQMLTINSDVIVRLSLLAFCLISVVVGQNFASRAPNSTGLEDTICAIGIRVVVELLGLVTLSR